MDSNSAKGDSNLADGYLTQSDISAPPIKQLDFNAQRIKSGNRSRETHHNIGTYWPRPRVSNFMMLLTSYYNKVYSRLGFLNLGTLAIWGWVPFLLWRACPVHYRMISSTPGFYPLNARYPLPLGSGIEKQVQTLQNVPWSNGGKIAPS